jgi:hypothetical protein
MTPEKILELLPKKTPAYVTLNDGRVLSADCTENRIRNATIDDCANALAGKVVLLKHTCPFDKATTCYEDYKCNGCETHAEFISEWKSVNT